MGLRACLGFQVDLLRREGRFGSRPNRVLGTVMGNTVPSHHRTSYARNRTVYCIGTWDPLDSISPVGPRLP